MSLIALLAPLLAAAPEAPLEGHALSLTADPNEATLRYQWRGALRMSFLATHESAHETYAPTVVEFNLGGASPTARAQTTTLLLSSQVHTNDVGLCLLGTMTRGTNLLAVVLTQRFHFASCTLRARCCEDVRFSFGLETELDLMLEAFALDRERWLRPYAAISAMVIPAIEDMGREGRVVLEAGATLDPGRLGRFRLFFAFLTGHEPGFRRERAVVVAGLGIGFAFF